MVTAQAPSLEIVLWLDQAVGIAGDVDGKLAALLHRWWSGRLGQAAHPGRAHRGRPGWRLRPQLARFARYEARRRRAEGATLKEHGGTARQVAAPPARSRHTGHRGGLTWLRLVLTRPIVLVSGEPPYLLHRVSYLTDPAYAGHFDANPLHVPSHEGMTVSPS
jgi:hypothetical protein